MFLECLGVPGAAHRPNHPKQAMTTIIGERPDVLRLHPANNEENTRSINTERGVTWGLTLPCFLELVAPRINELPFQVQESRSPFTPKNPINPLVPQEKTAHLAPARKPSPGYLTRTSDRRHR